MAFDLVRSEVVYAGRVYSMRRDTLRVPDGQVVELEIVDHPGAVTIVPVDAEGRIWFVRQYRHAAGEMLLELPAGKLNAHEAPEVCAAREVREEIGMAAGRLQHIGAFFLAPGYSTEYMHIYLATELVHAPLAPDADEFFAIERIPIAQTFELAQTGQLRDAKSLAALWLAKKFLIAD